MRRLVRGLVAALAAVPFTVLAVVTGPIGALIVFERVRRDEPAIHAREQAALRQRAAAT